MVSRDEQDRPAPGSGSGRERAGGARAGRPGPRARPAARGDAQGRVSRPRVDSRAGAPVRPRRVEPALPPEADAGLLDDAVQRELRGLSPENTDIVGRHLVAAGMLLEEDPAAALDHARAARGRAGRLACVREACGLAAYAAGEYAEARTELRAARRISGNISALPVLADCERALGHPEQALAVAADPLGVGLDAAARVELAMVVSGARRDLGQPAAAVAVLEAAALKADADLPWTPRLWYAYAEALLAAGRHPEALRWFTAAAVVDEESLTDAAERASLLTG